MELFYLTQYKKTTLNVAGGINDSQTTGIVVQNTDGVDKTKPNIVAVTYDEPLDTSKVEFIAYTSISASNELQGVTRGAEGFSAKSHSNGATVAFILSKSHLNNLIDAVTEEHNSDGTHDVSAMITGGSVLDEDDMSSDSATALATQQSIKAYVDKDQLYSAQIYLGTNQTLNTTATKLQFDTIRYDKSGGVMPDTTNHRIKIPTTGTYMISAAYRESGGQAGDRLQIEFRINGVQKLYGAEICGSSSNFQIVTLSVPYILAKDDYVEIYAYDAARSISAIGYASTTYLSVALINSY